MTTPLRLLFTRAPAAANWRAGFDLAQASAALDVPLVLAFAGPALELIVPRVGDTETRAGSGAWASLALLGVERVYATVAGSDGFDRSRSALPVLWLDAADWREWLRSAPVQGW